METKTTGMERWNLSGQGRRLPGLVCPRVTDGWLQPKGSGGSCVSLFGDLSRQSGMVLLGMDEGCLYV